MTPRNRWQLGGALIVGLAAFSVFFVRDRMPMTENGNRLWFFIEAFFRDVDYRDVGKSLNGCEGARDGQFAEGVLLRSSRYFSGHSCGTVGDPDRIYTLSYEPDQKWEYYCRKDDGSNLVGSFQNHDFEIEVVEDLTEFDKPQYRNVLCGEMRDIITDIADGRRVLIHCNRGRDRTGAMIAILVKMMAESINLLDVGLVSAIECDYQKTSTIKAEHIGHMQRFLDGDFKERGGAEYFIDLCGIPRDRLVRAARRFLR